VYAVFIVGTAGSGKSQLTSILAPHYVEMGNRAVTVNLDPGVTNLPYNPDVDIRNYVNLQEIMDRYSLGPNGALIMASDLVATKLSSIQEELDELKADYAIIDTPGQMELFVYRTSGPYIVQNLACISRAALFLFDPTLMATPDTFVSIALVGASLQMRLNVPQVSLLTKKDVDPALCSKIMRWSSDAALLDYELRGSAAGSQYTLSAGVLRTMIKMGLGYELIPFSSVTHEGLVELSASLARIFRGGEEVED
jgi:GTPase SAR1 family protein